MAKAIEHTLNWHYGDSFDDIVINVKNQDGTPVSLAGYAARMDIKVTPDAVTSVLTLTTSPNDGITIDATTGQVRCNATYTKMLSGNLAVDTIYHYQLQIQNDTVRRTLLGGRFVSLADIAEN